MTPLSPRIKHNAVELTVYALLSAAAGLLFFAVPPQAADLSFKDTPGGYGTSARVPRPIHRAPQPAPSVPLPARADRYTIPQPVPGGRASFRRELFLRCASYYVIAKTILEDEEQREEYRVFAIAALREAQTYPEPEDGWRMVQDSVFMDMMQEYTEAVAKGEGLYDRYEETCNAVVRPLLQNERTEPDQHDGQAERN